MTAAGRAGVKEPSLRPAELRPAELRSALEEHGEVGTGPEMSVRMQSILQLGNTVRIMTPL